MNRMFLVGALLCSLVFPVFGEDLNLTEGEWYYAILEKSGELRINESTIIIRLKPDGSVEKIFGEKTRRQIEEMRQRVQKTTGKELTDPSSTWEWKDNKLTINTENAATRSSVVFVPAGQNDILRNEDKKGVMLLARKGAKLTPEQARQFYQEVQEANRDKFADNLSLPENVELAEPAPERCNTHFFNHTHWRDAPQDSFQQIVLKAINHGRTLDDDAKCQLPALEKLLATPENKALLLKYLACSSDWRLYTQRNNTLHAVRYFRYPDGSVAPSLNNFYSHYLPTDAQSRKKVGEAELEFQFRFEIDFEGVPWNSNYPPFPRSQTEHEGNAWDTRFRCGEALVNICDHSQFAGRQMTAAALEYVEKEFSGLLDDQANWRSLLPPDSIRVGQPDLILRDGMQGGIYEAELWCNPGAKGMVYLKAFEMTKGTQLSAMRLEQSSNCLAGWSDNPEEQFFSAMHFTIYEGEWNQFYGARFEVWFRPDNGAAERKLFEKSYRIQGWQR